jgi:hypothetical protein
VFNEIVTYLVCVYLLVFNNFLTAEMRVTMGYFLLGAFVCFLAFNIIIMLILLCRNLIQHLRRCTTKSRRRKLRTEVSKILQRLKKWFMEAKEKEEKDWFVPDQLDNVWEPVTRYTRGGGASCVFQETILPQKSHLHEDEVVE